MQLKETYEEKTNRLTGSLYSNAALSKRVGDV
jgi:hypothetical protein